MPLRIILSCVLLLGGVMGVAFADQRPAPPERPSVPPPPPPPSTAAETPGDSVEVLLYVLGPDEGNAKPLPEALNSVAKSVECDFGASDLKMLGEGMALTVLPFTDQRMGGVEIQGNCQLTADKAAIYKFSAGLLRQDVDLSSPNSCIKLNLLAFHIEEQLFITPPNASDRPKKREKTTASSPSRSFVSVERQNLGIQASFVSVPLGSPTLVGHFSLEMNRTPIYVVVLARRAG